MPARIGSADDWSTSADLNWGSTALVQRRGPEMLIVDAETREFRVTLQRDLSDRLSIQLQVPYRYTGAGMLDGFIDEFHQATGLPDGARSELPTDAIRIDYWNSGALLLDVRSPSSGLADVQAAAGYEWIVTPTGALSAWLSIKLPTGDADYLTGSGATDVSLLVAGERRLGQRWLVFGQAGVSWLGDGDLMPAQQRSVAWSGLAGIEWRPWRGLGLKAQFDAHSAVYDSDLDFLGETLLVTVGGDYRFESGWQLDVGLSEDIVVETSPDVVFVLGLRRAF